MSSGPVRAVLPAAYFPPVEYFMVAAITGDILVEAQDSYIKQTYRNRCRIYACDGILSLAIPVSLPAGCRKTDEAFIDYSKPWLQQHERALISAYRTSAFFEYYQDDIFPILDSRYSHLLELDYNLILKLMDMLGLRCKVTLTSEYIRDYGPDCLDLRYFLHPKKTVPDFLRDRFRPYYQVFSGKYGFISGLSVLDLLFNEGPNSLSFL